MISGDENFSYHEAEVIDVKTSPCFAILIKLAEDQLGGGYVKIKLDNIKGLYVDGESVVEIAMPEGDGEILSATFQSDKLELISLWIRHQPRVECICSWEIYGDQEDWSIDFPPMC